MGDGYRNHRVAVYDGLTGRYLRHWGADGKPPCDAREGCPNLQYQTPHGIVGSRDGLIYVADRTNSRVQGLRSHGATTMVRGVTREGQAGAFSVALSPDPQQRWVYRDDGEPSTAFWILSALPT